MTKPVLFVPGLPASHVHDRQSSERLFFSFGKLFPKPDAEVLRRLEGPADLSAADPTITGEPIKRLAQFLFFDLAKQADSLYEILKRVGVVPVGFGWDWRRPVWDAPMLENLRGAITGLRARSGRKVVLIVHSTGGLAVRRLLEQAEPAFLDQIERVIAFGVPWAGTLKSLRFLRGAGGLPPISKQQAQRLLAHSWAAFDLLPPDPAKTDMTGADGTRLDIVVDGAGRQTSPLVRRDWFAAELREAMTLRAEGADRELGRRTPSLLLAGGRTLPVTNVVGFGGTTTIQAVISGAGSQQQVTLTDGKGDQTLDGGDETIPRVSAAWLRGSGVSTYHVPIGVDHGAEKSPHSELWRNPGGRDLLRHLVGGESLPPFAYGAVDDKDFGQAAQVRLRLVALDAVGDPLPGASVRTLDLASGPQLEEAFDPQLQGRHLIRLPRARIRKVQNGRLRRFEVEIRWPGGAQRRAYAIQP